MEPYSRVRPCKQTTSAFPIPRFSILIFIKFQRRGPSISGAVAGRICYIPLHWP